MITTTFSQSGFGKRLLAALVSKPEFTNKNRATTPPEVPNSRYLSQPLPVLTCFNTDLRLPCSVQGQ